MRIYYTLLFLFSLGYTASAQYEIKGVVTDEQEKIPYVNIYIPNSSYGTYTDEEGNFSLTIKEEGLYTIVFQAIGFQSLTKKIHTKDLGKKPLNINLKKDLLGLEQVVVSATRNRVNAKKAPVVVNILGEKLFNATQSIAVAESLNYQPGVRVETNCQNCGFTQVRLNGLDGSYTQVLINSRAVFSALNSVYGLEQIPTSILDRIEVVRSGGSALYGSNAIAGTINIITKDPVLNSWEVGGNLGLIDGKVADRTTNVNASVVSEDLKSGVTVFGMNRNRDAYDADNDGFSEITELTNTTMGAKAFFKPNELNKLSIDLTAIDEYRRGGNKLDLAPHQTDITEQLNHNTFLGGITYDITNKKENNKFSIYASGQHTDRKSYYGGLGGGRTSADSILAANAYGNTKDLAVLGGGQFTHQFKNNDILTAGAEYNYNNTEDAIAGYNRVIDQEVNALGAFAQYEWKPSEKFTALLGARLDNINVTGSYQVGNVQRSVDIDQTAFSPRITLMYDVNENLKFRGGYARGFRAPQAFNEDLHVSSVGGEPQFVILSENLDTEYSNAFTASLNFTKNYNKVQTNFLIEGFYTTLENPFTPVSTGATLANGSILEEIRNGEGAYVAGTNFELGISPSERFIFQLGGTLQQAKYNKPQLLYEATTPEESNILIDKFVRNPNTYGYFNTNYKVTEATTIDLTGTYTGSMTVPRVISDTGFLQLNKTDAFFNMNFKLSHHIDFTDTFHITLHAGVQNIFNSYQDDFDTGATRDSDYIYGPSQPRTFFFGLKFGNLHN